MANSDQFENDDGSNSEGMSAMSGGLGPMPENWRHMLAATPGTDSLSLSQFAVDPSEGLQVEDIEAMLTTPLEKGGAPGVVYPGAHPGTAEQQRSRGEPVAEPTTPRRTAPPSQRAGEEFVSVTLRQRRAEDERMTGRRWPGNGVAYPGSAQEAAFFEQLAIALGEADPRVLARECALRYVRSSRIPGEDELGPTDIYAIAYYGLGLTIRPLDCTGLPQALALYHRATRDVYIDWKLLQEPPFGRATLEPTAWRRAVDGSMPARFLLAWCAAVHLTDNYDLPLMLGFTPHPSTAPVEGVPAQPAISPDVMNRYRKALLAVAALLAPEERLWRQIAALGLPLQPGDRNWRMRIRAEYGYTGGRRDADGRARPSAGPFAPGTQTDPAEHLVVALAERNNCPPLLVAAQLDGMESPPDWGGWSLQLLTEIPELQMRYQAAARMFHLAAVQAGNRGRLAPEIQPIAVQLSL